MQLLEGHLPWIVDTFRPDLVLYDAGVDPHVKDEVGKLRLTDQGESLIFYCQTSSYLSQRISFWYRNYALLKKIIYQKEEKSLLLQ